MKFLGCFANNKKDKVESKLVVTRQRLHSCLFLFIRDQSDPAERNHFEKCFYIENISYSHSDVLLKAFYAELLKNDLLG